jgi:hypothetical protein
MHSRAIERWPKQNRTNAPVGPLRAAFASESGTRLQISYLPFEAESKDGSRHARTFSQILRGPHFADVDTTLFKDVFKRESVAFQLGAQA